MITGTWEAEKGSAGVFVTMSDSSRVYVAEAMGATMDIKESRAALIAAAPELLGACKKMLLVGEFHDQTSTLTVKELFPERFKMLTEAIAAAM